MSSPDPFLGVLLHAAGGLAAGSFYLPFKGVRRWSWETYWLVGGIFSWLLAPWIVAFLTVPDPVGILSKTPGQALINSYAFGVLWGIGGLTFGLSMRYLGMSLGYALALGACAAFGTLVPPLVDNTFGDLVARQSGQVVLGGVGLCLFGIAVCGRAGVYKEREMPDEQKRAVITEFNFRKGVWVALFCGILSACMAYGIRAGRPMADAALAAGADPLWQNVPIFIVILAGGFTSNLIWCVYLNWKNRTGHEYLSFSGAPVAWNILFAATAGITWYLQFMFYGMGETQLGKEYNFSSWTLHMAFIIVFSNVWALLLHEWKGTSSRTRRVVATGLAILVVSTMVIGYGNRLGTTSPEPGGEQPGAARPGH